jgi:hypothetical protein
MATVSAHHNIILPTTWPFQESEHTLSYTSQQVMDGDAPVLLVFHDHEGEWQFLHGEVGEADVCKIICLGCAYSHDQTIGMLSSLPLGWMAYRDSINGPWQSEPYGDDSSVEV